jgi:nitroimidazol reductase NimA-like FMN-containing flavoprotein (pyridoxamine 5'-phosphate oxidase superfamily)
MATDKDFSIVPRDECLRLLASQAFGRVAMIRHVLPDAMPAIIPVNYALADEAVLFRTASSTVLSDAAGRRATVAFETDHIDLSTSTGWSVTVTGPLSEVTDKAELRHFRDEEPRPWAPGERDLLLRVEIQYLTGRRISLRTGAGTAAAAKAQAES